MTAKKHFYSYAVSLILMVFSTLVALPLRDELTLANFTMLYLLVVFIIAIQYGTLPAFMAAFVNFLCINFFLVQPYYTFLVADPRELLDLIVFLIVAALAGKLGADVRQRAEEARKRAYEQEILYHLTRSFNQTTTPKEVYEALAQVVKDDLEAQQAYVLPHDSKTISHDPASHYLLLQAGNEVYATLCAVFETHLSAEKEQLLSTCASQAAMALQRIDLNERARRSQKFEEADRLKTAILHAVSHDLRTPITIIKTSAHNLRHLNSQLAPDERDEITATIECEADELNKLVSNLLDLSRLEAGALQLNCRLNSLEEVAGDVAARVWQLTKQERIKIMFPEDMPLVKFDYDLILRALSNLTDNALRYEPATSQIEIQGVAQSNQVCVKVINHGETITPDEKELIMQPFYHGKTGRTGLGLPIAKGIIEAHHGRLWVEDTRGSGATFVITLALETEVTEREIKNTGG